MCKIQICETAITSDDIDHTWETILNECSQKAWKGFEVKGRANIQSETSGVETITEETGWMSRFETLSYMVVQIVRMMVDFGKPK